MTEGDDENTHPNCQVACVLKVGTNHGRRPRWKGLCKRLERDGGALALQSGKTGPDDMRSALCMTNAGLYYQMSIPCPIAVVLLVLLASCVHASRWSSQQGSHIA